MRLTDALGYSLLDITFVLAAMTTMTGMSIQPLTALLEDYRAAGAARYVSARIQRVRMEAASRSTNAAIQIVPSGTGYAFGLYVDGNGDGVRTADIATGIDPPIAAIERLPDNFPGVDFAVSPGLPPVDPGGTAPGADPIAFGAGHLISYSASGTSSSGSVYICGRHGAQYVIRVLGDTGRTRVLRFDGRVRQWKPL
jgi:type II secretion system GspH-like protein